MTDCDLQKCAAYRDIDGVLIKKEELQENINRKITKKGVEYEGIVYHKGDFILYWELSLCNRVTHVDFYRAEKCGNDVVKTYRKALVFKESQIFEAKRLYRRLQREKVSMAQIQLEKLMEEIGNRIFKVKFVKRTTGEERIMLCRRGVKKGLKGVGPRYDFKAKNLISVYDMQKKDYRLIPVEGVVSITFNKRTYNFKEQT